MPENTSLAPEWVDDKTINEVLFCREFLEEHPMISVGGAFFTKDGLVADEHHLRKEVYDDIKHHITTGLWKKVSNLVEVLRMECCADALPLYEDRIHVANGTVFLDGSFSEEKDFCRNRLPVAYRFPMARLPFPASLSGGYSHLAGVLWLLPDSLHPWSENAADHRKRR